MPTAHCYCRVSCGLLLLIGVICRMQWGCRIYGRVICALVLALLLGGGGGGGLGIRWPTGGEGHPPSLSRPMVCLDANLAPQTF